MENKWGVLTGNEIIKEVKKGQIVISPFDENNIDCARDRFGDLCNLQTMC